MTPQSPFDDVAELYDAIRPRYPEALFDELVSTARLQPDSRLLEIAPGTGQATLPLARRGFHITAVELGANMTRIARENLKDYSRVAIINSSFEDVDLPLDGFDLAYAASALHWIAPKFRFAKPHAHLKETGHLAIIRRNKVSDEDGDVFANAAQSIYERYKWDSTRTKALGARRRTEVTPPPLDLALFELACFKTFPVAARYSAAEYASLLNTVSWTILMPDAERASLLGDIRQLIDERFNGVVVQHYAMSLLVARKK
jgi:SAM-dependent methyltransferase